MRPIGHPGMKGQVIVAGNTTHLVSIALQKEAKFNATLVTSKQKTVLFPDTCVNWAIKTRAHPQLPACGSADQWIYHLVALSCEGMYVGSLSLVEW